MLHRVQIHRREKALEKLDRSKIKLIQREPDLSGHVLTGEQTAVLFVEDLRIGDALEYAYTVRGDNPILDGHYAARFLVRRGVPIDRQVIRILWPSSKRLYQRQYLIDATPATKPYRQGHEYLWDFANFDAVPYEDELPESYDPYPAIELSDFESWARVVDWALPLYSPTSSNLPSELGDLVKQWVATPTKAEAARMALTFVQDELRYTGIELGPDSYRPVQPSETFQLRFGDCKAKAFLFCTLLHQMGIEAWPALVNTSARESVAHRLPSPFAFDHVIVKLLLDGKPLWVDPTRSHQGGLLSERHFPRLGRALVVNKGVTDLEEIPPSGARSLRRVFSTFRLKDYRSPASLTVRTLYHGSEADSTREYFARDDPKEIAKQHLNFYARYYPGVRERQPPELHDQRLSNILEVTEHYEIHNLWKLNKSSQQWEANFYSEALEEMLTDPDTRIRTMPLGLSYPSRREQDVTIHMPDNEWDIPSSKETIETDAFTFHSRYKSSGKTIELHYDCETRLPEIPVEKVPLYLEKLKQMRDSLGETLFQPDTSLGAVLSQLNWLMVVIAMFSAAATAGAGVWVWRVTRVTDGAVVVPLLESSPDAARLHGLGGWLILVGFGLCVNFVWRLTFLAKNWRGFFSNAAWQAVAVPGAEHYHSLYGPLLIFEVLGNVIFTALNILAIGLFFTKRRIFPKVYITLMIGTALFFLVDEIAGNAIPYEAQQSRGTPLRTVVRSVVQAILWSSYILKSKRVKATFIR